MDWRIDLRTTRQPSKLSDRNVHELRGCSKEVIMDSQELLWMTLSMRWMQRNLDRRELQHNPRIWSMWAWMDLGVLKNNILEFSVLIVVPEASLNSFKILWILRDSLVVGVPIIMVSSTNWLWEIGGWMPCSEIPWRESYEMDSLMYRLKPFTMMKKRKGESGSPWRIPLDGVKVLKGISLSRMEKKVV